MIFWEGERVGKGQSSSRISEPMATDTVVFELLAFIAPENYLESKGSTKIEQGFVFPKEVSQDTSNETAQSVPSFPSIEKVPRNNTEGLNPEAVTAASEQDGEVGEPSSAAKPRQKRIQEKRAKFRIG